MTDYSPTIRRRGSRKRLRRQPKRRMQALSAPVMVYTALSQTARRRRRQQLMRQVAATLSQTAQFLLTARWLSLGTLATVGYGLFFVASSGQFYLTRIPVDGVVAIPPANIVAASGLAGRHIFAADPGAAASAITGMPGVLSARVTLAWPNEVYVSIVEDSPVAVWLEDGQSYWVAADGELMPVQGMELPGLLVIESEQVEEAEAVDEEAAEDTLAARDTAEGEVIEEETDEDAVVAEEDVEEKEAKTSYVPREVLQGALLLRQLRPNIDHLYYEPAGGLSYQDGRGWRGYFGTGADMQQKLVVYETLVADLLARGVNPVTVSVSNQAKPFYLSE